MHAKNQTSSRMNWLENVFHQGNQRNGWPTESDCDGQTPHPRTRSDWPRRALLSQTCAGPHPCMGQPLFFHKLLIFSVKHNPTGKIQFNWSFRNSTNKQCLLLFTKFQSVFPYTYLCISWLLSKKRWTVLKHLEKFKQALGKICHSRTMLLTVSSARK